MKNSPDSVGTGMGDKGARASERVLAAMPGPTMKYGASSGPTGNAGSMKEACKLLARQDDRKTRNA